MPFLTVYGSEIVFPTKLQYEYPKVQACQPVEAEQTQRDAIDFLQESRDIVVAKSVGYQQTLRWYHAIDFLC
jgi:hypothetical protein